VDSRVAFLMTQIEQDIRERLSVDTMARMVNLSPSHLAHLFKQETQVSIQHFRRQARMQHAKRLLETSFLSVKQVMLTSGFRDASHFVRDFRRQFGKTPSQCRSDLKARVLANK
jgi:transcriptional regulator GlxA family with amidase domain